MAPVTAPGTTLSLAFFGTKQGELLRGFARLAKVHLGATGILHVGQVLQTPTGRVASVAGLHPQTVAPEDLGFERVPISFSKVEKELAQRLDDMPEHTVLAVDMGWGLQTTSATANFESWMGVAQNLVAATGRAVVSLYNRSLLIDDTFWRRCAGIRAYWRWRGWCPIRTGFRRRCMPGAHCASRSISGWAVLRPAWSATTPLPTATPPRVPIRCGF
jgi:hypothetical protein